MKMILVCLFVYSLFAYHPISTFNIDSNANNRIRFTIDQSSNLPDNKTFFGYSLGFFGGILNTRIIIGAPRDNDRNGSIFNCLVNGNDHTCSPLNMNKPGGNETGDQGSKGELLGVSISTTASSISACAQLTRFKTSVCQNAVRPSVTCLNFNNLFMGRCPVLDSSFNFKFSSTPCFNANTNPNPKRYGMCSLGISQHSFYSGNDKKLYQFLTAPGSGSYAGSVVATANGDKVSRFINKEVLIDDSRFDRSVTERETLLGYSSTKGNFTGDKVPGLASGAPRKNTFRGEVIIYRYVINNASVPPSSQDSTLSVVSTIQNPIGESGGPSFFGAALASIDINNDNFDDLVVGAPLFSIIVGNRIGQDEGRAFVFINIGNGTFKHDASMTLVGTNQERSRFGSTIVNIGDINNDGFDDLAVSAPWGGPDGHGVVYIYNGRNGRLKNIPSQILNSPEQSDVFGFSIAAAKIDSRVYPALAVGAPRSGRVYLFKARTIITLEDRLWADKTFIPTDKSNCEFKGVKYQCIRFRPILKDVSTNAPPVFDVEITVKPDYKHKTIASRAFVYDNDTDSLVESFSRNVTLMRGQTVSFEVRIYLTLDKSTNFEFPVTIAASYKSIDTNNNCMNGMCAILDQFGAVSGSVDVRYLKLCGSDNICNIDLEIGSAEVKVIKGTSSQVDRLLIGSFNNEIKLLANVTNRLESAYLAKMAVDYDENFAVLQTFVKKRSVIVEYDGKKENGTGKTLRFLLDNPILVRESVDIEVKFILKDLQQLTVDSYPFHLAVSSTGIDGNSGNNIKTVSVPMGIQSCVTLALDQRGNSANQAPLVLYNHGIPAKPNEIGPKMEYTLLVQNNGRVFMENISIDVTIVERVGNQDVTSVTELSIDGTICPFNNNKLSGGTNSSNSASTNVKPPILNCDNGQCRTYSCNILNLQVNGIRRLKLSLSVFLAALQKLESNEMIIGIKTNFNGKFPALIEQQVNCDANMQLRQPFARLQKAAQNKEGKEWWPVLVAVVGALIFLAIICAILYRIGFFKRNRPEEATPTDSPRIEAYKAKTAEYESE